MSAQLMVVEPGRDREGVTAVGARPAASPEREPSALALLAHLRSLELHLWLDGDRLRWSAPRGVATPELLARVAEHRDELRALLRGGGPGPALPPIERVPRGASFPLSHSQLRLWFLVEFAPELPAYNQLEAVRIDGPLRVAELARSLEEVVLRHESLRTTFAARGGEPFQVVASRLRVSLPVVDLAALPAAAGEEAAYRLARRSAERLFDLVRGPLVRASLVRFAGHRHWLLLDVHHLATDRWSMGIFSREMAVLYEAFCAGSPSPLPPLPLHFVDYACWQRRWLESAAAAPLLDYWRRQLAGAPPVLPLPLDRPRRPRRIARAGYLPVAVPAALHRGIRELGRALGATPYMVLLAAFDALLARYTGETDLTVGTLIANRNRPELEGVIGFFVNNLALRVEVDEGQPFLDLLRRVQGVTLGAYAHQDVPFEKLIEELQPERHTNYSPLFQVMLVLQNTPAPRIELPGLAVSQLDLGLGVWGPVDFGLWLWPEGEGLTGFADFAADLFDATTIRRLLRDYWRLLAAVVAAPQLPPAALPLPGPAERWQLVGEWNDRAIPAAPPAGLSRLFEGQAAARPEAVAAGCEGEVVSYGELNARGNRLARRLRRLGVGPESRVGLATGRNLDTPVGILGILKAGGAYLPLDPSYPAARLAYTLTDAGAELLVARREALAVLPPAATAEGRRSLCLDDEGGPAAGDGEADLASAPDAADLAYVIYTSGSTGRPKGSLLRHRNVTRLFTATEPWFGFGASDVWTLFHSYAFDFSVWEIWGALLYGGRLVVVPFLVSRSPADFWRLLVAEGVTVLNQTPSAFRALLAAEGEGAAPRETALRLVIFGGEALEPAGLGGWFERHGEARPRLVNMYGITETTVHVTYRPLGRGDVAGAPRSPVGRPIPDLTVHLLDPHGRPVPIGVPGELYVGGAGVGSGYLGRPGLTAARFVPDPFAGTGTRLYRSGDLVRHAPDGDLCYLGRLDQQVQLRGFRIELGEIEVQLAARPEVREAVVALREDLPGGPALVAYAVAAEGAAASAAEIKAALRATLPDYMVPSLVLLLDALPHTPSGKVDRRRLPAPEWKRSQTDEGFRAPATPVEEQVAKTIAEVLGLERVGLDDDFFALGGHSLLVTQVVARLGEAFGVELPVRSLFDASTTAELAVRIEETVLARIEELSEEEAGALL